MYLLFMHLNDLKCSFYSSVNSLYAFKNWYKSKSIISDNLSSLSHVFTMNGVTSDKEKQRIDVSRWHPCYVIWLVWEGQPDDVAGYATLAEALQLQHNSSVYKVTLKKCEQCFWQMDTKINILASATFTFVTMCSNSPDGLSDLILQSPCEKKIEILAASYKFYNL